MTIREEFEGALKEQRDNPVGPSGAHGYAVWAAKWAMERLCDYQDPQRCALETPQECKACLAAKELER